MEEHVEKPVETIEQKEVVESDQSQQQPVEVAQQQNQTQPQQQPTQTQQPEQQQGTSFFSKLFRNKEKEKAEQKQRLYNHFNELLRDVKINPKMLEPQEPYNPQKKFRMISMDGGGIKCLMQITILERLLKKYPTLLEDTNLFCGVSASSFICCDIALGMSPKDIRTVLTEFFKHIFEKKSTGLMSALYSNEYMIQTSEMTYGDKKLSDLQRKVFVYAFQIDSGKEDPERKCKACHFNNFLPGHDCRLADACIRSSAAVGYFPPYQGYADGGIFDNNPCTFAFPFVFGEEGFHADMKNTVCLSLSSGRPPEMFMDQEKYADVGKLRLLPVTYDGFFWSRKSMADEVARGYLGERYMRFDPVLHDKLDLDQGDQIDYIISLGQTMDLTPIEEWIEKYWL